MRAIRQVHGNKMVYGLQHYNIFHSEIASKLFKVHVKSILRMVCKHIIN